MSIHDLEIFQMAKMRMDWASQRQKVLSQNIANANTPGYKARDVKELDFKKLATRSSHQVDLVRTHVAHQASTAPSAGPYRTAVTRYPFESSPDGNEVVLEEQMSALADTKHEYTVALELVKKHLSLIKMVTRSSR